MEISSLLQNNYISSLGSSTSTRSSQKTQTSEDLLKDLGSKQDTVSISAEARAYSKMPPPKDMDFSNMSDEDLSGFLQKMQEKTGKIPGMDEGTDVSELTSEQLQDIREQMASMSEQMKNMGGMRGVGGMQGMGRMQGPPLNIQEMSDDDLKSLLADIQEKTGSIPGLEDSEGTDVPSLTDEQLQSARDALMEQMKKRMEEMSQYSSMSGTASSFAFGASEA